MVRLYLPEDHAMTMQGSAPAIPEQVEPATAFDDANQSRSANCSRSATVATKPYWVRIDKYSSTLLAGFLRRARTLRSAEQTRPGARDSWFRKKSSGCCVSMPKGASASGGKSFKGVVTLSRAFVKLWYRWCLKPHVPRISRPRMLRTDGSGW